MNSIQKKLDFFSFPPISNIAHQPMSLAELMKLPPNEWENREVHPHTIEKFYKECGLPEPCADRINVECCDLENRCQIAVIGKIDDYSSDHVTTILQSLQEDNYLDENYQCTENHMIVFLCPPVTNNKAFELLLTLKRENMNQVYLLSNESEANTKEISEFYDTKINIDKFQDYREKNKAFELEKIQKFYQSLPQSVFLGQTNEGKKQYVQFAYNLSGFCRNLSDLLDECPTDISKSNNNKEKVCDAVNNINKFLSLSLMVNKDTGIGSRLTYEDSQLKTIPVEIVHSIFLSASTNPVKGVFLGQPYPKVTLLQDSFAHKTLKNKTKAITISPSNTQNVNIFHLTVKEKVKNWKAKKTTLYPSLNARTHSLHWKPFLNQPEQITLTSMADLMTLPHVKWKDRNIEFLNLKIKKYLETCDRLSDSLFVEKTDLKSPSKIAVIGDLHGNDLRLIATLKKLQNDHFLDENFRCTPDHHLIFLGDYVDRGNNSLKVLELLITLKLENANQVQILRGNHEDYINHEKLYHYSINDDRYYNYRMDCKNEDLLTIFFNNLPSSYFLGQDDYAEFSHAGVYFATDFSSLLEKDITHFSIDHSPLLNDKIQSLITSETSLQTKQEKKLLDAAKELDQLYKRIIITPEDILWHDLQISENEVKQDKKRERIPLKALKAYFTLNGTTKKVKCLIRGHQHLVTTHRLENSKLVAITLDPSDDEQQTILILNTAPKFRNWTKEFHTFPIGTNFVAKGCEKNSILWKISSKNT